MSPKGNLFVISAPTGGGKTTIAKQTLEILSSKMPLEKVITYTTRLPRLNESNGVDYYFVDHHTFQTLQAAGFFLETTRYDQNFYGCSRNILDEIKRGKSFLLITDRHGAATIKELYPKAILVWFDIPSLEVLKERLTRRGRETGTALEQRLAIAAKEIDEEKETPIFDVHFVNDDLASATNALIALIQSKRAV